MDTSCNTSNPEDSLPKVLQLNAGHHRKLDYINSALCRENQNCVLRDLEPIPQPLKKGGG